jgi:hypothetical protein
MFESPTVFVLGAGSSAGFGFPTGVGLRGLIEAQVSVIRTEGRTRIQQDTEVFSAHRNSGNHEYDKCISDFETLRHRLYAYDSIDELLDAQESEPFVQIGKLAIAHAIGNVENECEKRHFQLASQRSSFWKRMSGSWMAALMRQMIARVPVKSKPEDIAKNVGFVSFNYDRSLEQFMHAAMRELGVPSESIAKVLNSIPIFHPYGTLGDLEWQSSQKNVTPFGEARHGLNAAASSIRTFTEQIEDGPELKTMRKMVLDASKIVFLGFGFHRQNVQLIAPGYTTGRKVFATAYKCLSGEQQRIDHAIRDHFGLLQNGGDWSQDCDEFANSYMKLIAAS